MHSTQSNRSSAATESRFIEPLEHRIAPAGVVSVVYAAGVLTIDGDGVANEIEVTRFGVDGVLVNGVATDVSLNGSPAGPGISILGGVQEVKFQMGGGADHVQWNGLAAGKLGFDGGVGDDHLELLDSQFTGDVSFTGGEDSDSLSTLGTVSIKGALSADGGNGNDTFYLGDDSAQFLGGVKVTGGEGDDLLKADPWQLYVGKGFSADLGNGDDKVEFELNYLTVVGPLSITHGIATNGTENVFYVKHGFDVRGAFSYDLGSAGAGTQKLTISSEGSMSVAGGLGFRASSSAALTMVSIEVAGTVSAKGLVTVDSTAGNFSFIIASSSFLAKGLSYQGGSGQDFCRLQCDTVRLGPLVAALGDGSNVLSIDTNDGLVTSMKYTGAGGADNMLISGSNFSVPKGITAEVGAGLFGGGIGVAGTFSTSALAVDASAADGASFGIDAAYAKTGAVVVKLGSEADSIYFEIGMGAIKSIEVDAGAGSNDVNFHFANGKVGAVTIRGGADADSVDVETKSLTTGALTFDLGDGDNEITTTIARLVVGGTLSITAGGGEDVIDIDAAVLVAKSMLVYLGDGHADGFIDSGDFIVPGVVSVRMGNFGGPGFSNFDISSTNNLTLGAVSYTIAPAAVATFNSGLTADGFAKIKSVAYTGGAGDDIFAVVTKAASSVGAVAFDGGAGSNELTVALVNTKLAGLTYKGGAGADLLSLANVNGEAGNVKLNGGGGLLTATLNSTGMSGRFKGAVDIATETGAGQTAEVRFADANFLGAVKVTGAAGADGVFADTALFANTVSIDTADGADTIGLQATAANRLATFLKAVKLVLGDGDDTLNVGDAVTPATKHAIFKSTVSFDGGTGSDTANVSAATYGNVYSVAGQPVLTNFETSL